MKELEVPAGSLKKNVFIVEDHAVVREGLAQIINRENDLVVCGEASNVSDALRDIPQSMPDAIIVDLSLQDGSGLRLVENLSYSRSDLLVMVLSMYDESVYAERCLKAGARGYVMKQEPSWKMLSALRKVLKGEIYVSDEMGSKILNKFVSNKLEPSGSLLDSLSNREVEIYQLIGQGLRRQEIADRLNLSIRTIETYIEHIKKKMKFSHNHEVVTHAFKNAVKL